MFFKLPSGKFSINSGIHFEYHLVFKWLNRLYHPDLLSTYAILFVRHQVCVLGIIVGNAGANNAGAMNPIQQSPSPPIPSRKQY